MDKYQEFDFLSGDLSSDEQQSFMWKKQIANKLELSPEIVIISPFISDEKEYGMDELDQKYTKYISLIPKNKRFSDYYSINLWGYNVRDMYELMKKKIMTIDGVENTDFIFRGRVDELDSVMREVTENIVTGNKLGLLSTKLQNYNPNIRYPERALYENVNLEIDLSLNEDYSNCLSKVVPYFTLDEMNELCPDHQLGNINPKDYYKTLLETKRKYDQGLVSESELIALGWNPSVDINESTLNFARERQNNWLKKKGCNIVDITNLKTQQSLNESSSMMRQMYKDNNLYPVYIVLSYTDTLFAKMIRKVKHSTYTHAGLCLDSNLQTITTFKFGAEWNGFSTESLDYYTQAYEDAIVDVLCIFVDKNTKNKIEMVIKDFVSKQEKTKYGFGNIFNILINRTKNDPENLSLVCSQFVDVVLKLANIDITKKPSNLVIPQDFNTISTNPKIYKVYEGLAKEYSEVKVENSLRMLLKTYDRNSVLYTDNITFTTESYIESFYNITENENCNKVLEEIQYLLTPEAVIYEKKAPIEISDKGDVIIKLYKSLEEEYQEAHRLLKQYGTNNIEGIKHELARLFYVNSVIEKKIKKMEKDDDNYKKLIDLRARVLNDFKKYFKIVLEKEPEFDFASYFQKSEYYNGNIIIDNSLLRFTGKLIKKFLDSLGI